MQERKKVFCFPERVFFPLPPAWRPETLCWAHWGLTGAPEAHIVEGCWPGQGPEDQCGLGSLTGTSWRNKETKVRIYFIWITFLDLIVSNNRAMGVK